MMRIGRLRQYLSDISESAARMTSLLGNVDLDAVGELVIAVDDFLACQSESGQTWLLPSLRVTCHTTPLDQLPRLHRCFCHNERAKAIVHELLARRRDCDMPIDEICTAAREAPLKTSTPVQPTGSKDAEQGGKSDAIWGLAKATEAILSDHPQPSRLWLRAALNVICWWTPPELRPELHYCFQRWLKLTEWICNHCPGLPQGSERKIEQSRTDQERYHRDLFDVVHKIHLEWQQHTWVLPAGLSAEVEGADPHKALAAFSSMITKHCYNYTPTFASVFSRTDISPELLLEKCIEWRRVGSRLVWEAICYAIECHLRSRLNQSHKGMIARILGPVLTWPDYTAINALRCLLAMELDGLSEMNTWEILGEFLESSDYGCKMPVAFLVDLVVTKRLPRRDALPALVRKHAAVVCRALSDPNARQEVLSWVSGGYVRLGDACDTSFSWSRETAGYPK